MTRAEQIVAQLLEMNKDDFNELADAAFGIKAQLRRVMGPPNDGGVFSVESKLGDPGWGQFRVKPDADKDGTFWVTLLVDEGGGNQTVKLRTPADAMAFAKDISGLVVAVKRGLPNRARHLWDRMLEHSYASEKAGQSYADEHAKTMTGTFTVSSSCGEMEADVSTGKVVSVELYNADDEEDEDYLTGIDRFDVKEYEKWQRHPIYPGDGADILLIGGWGKDGEYWEPEQEARADSDAQFEDE